MRILLKASRFRGVSVIPFVIGAIHLLPAEMPPRKWREMSEPQPLLADSRRQANAMLAACDYQVWQTVSAWLDLRGDHLLFVEGAEDFDVVGAGEGEATQVKASPDPISLGQKSAQEALNNFWRL